MDVREGGNSGILLDFFPDPDFRRPYCIALLVGASVALATTVRLALARHFYIIALSTSLMIMIPLYFRIMLFKLLK